MGKESFAKTLESMGVSSDDIAQAIKVQFPLSDEDQDKFPEIQPANVIIVQLFFLVAKYWERIGMEAIAVCLDPIKVESRASKLRWYKQLDDDALELIWDGLDVMETACLQAWHKQREVKKIANE